MKGLSKRLFLQNPDTLVFRVQIQSVHNLTSPADVKNLSAYLEFQTLDEVIHQKVVLQKLPVRHFISHLLLEPDGFLQFTLVVCKVLQFMLH